MNAAWICLAGIAVFAAGYFFYARHLANHVFKLERDEAVPSVTLADGVDYVATPRPVLFGHHYASIAGAAPIIGPAIAVVWGWLPALVWIVLGTVFMGAVHDFSTLVLSMRHQGKSVGEISGRVIGPRSRTLFLLVIFALVLLVIAVFTKAIATLFITQPGTVIPINFQILVAVAIGYVCYKRKAALLWPSIAAFLALYAMVFAGLKWPISLSSMLGPDQEQMVWIVFLLGYSFVASVIPVWALLQPRDYINSHQLFVGLFVLVLGILVAAPEITAPALNVAPADAPAMLPFLFVTVACGAISGFHGLVSSGTTSKQIACAIDAKPVGYGGMLGEGLLALISTLAVSAGLANWAEHYHSYTSAAQGGVAAFVEGAATFLVALGIPRAPAQVVIAIMVISFAATSLDTGVRIQRYILEELGELYQVRPLRNRYLAGLVAVFLPFLLLLGGRAGQLWRMFGAANQILAGLSLIVVTVWLYRARRPWIYTGVPMSLVLLVAGASMAVNLNEYFQEGEYLLLGIGGTIFALLLWVVLEGIQAVRRPPKRLPEQVSVP